jgi:DNA-directed RNA polymerase specialized sigma24 family protein
MGSVTLWIGKLKAGDPDAVQKLWEDYFQRLVGLARTKLQAVARGMADEEDVALSAFHSFCRRAEEGRFPRLTDRHDLWQLLVLLTVRKASTLVQQERRQKRGGGKVRNASAMAGGITPSSPSGHGEQLSFADLVGREPDPGFAAQVAEECRRLLEKLGDATLQAIAVWKMEGHTNDEIAAKLGRCTGTIERKLQLIRSIWETEGKP